MPSKRVARREHQSVVLRDQQVFEHRHAGKQPNVLKGARDPRVLRDEKVGHALEQISALPTGQAALAAVGELFEPVPSPFAMPKREQAFGRFVEAGNAVEDGGLAGAIRTDQCGDIAAAAVNDRSSTAMRPPNRMVRWSTRSIGCRFRLPSAVTFLHEIARRRPFFSFRKTVGSRLVTRPRGRQIMISTMAKPNSSMRYCMGSKVRAEKRFQEIEFAQEFDAADDRHGGDSDADLRAQAAKHDDGQNNRRFHERKGFGRDEALSRGEK